MYTDWFQLAHKPFAITPDPRFLFLSERHREALAHLLFGVSEGGGFILLTGEVGTGKTTLTRTLLQQVPPNVDAALVFNPRVSLTEFLELICDELGVAVQQGHRTPKSMIDALNRHLLDAHARGRRTVLIVDEAQSLDPDLLEQVRLLTNLETDRDKLLQILLIGQPELRDTLARRDLRQLSQRITARFHLDPLEADESVAYVRHRLEVAGAREIPFTPAAMRAVHVASGGIPRLINVICDRALLGAWAQRATKVDAGMVRRAASEVRGDTPKPRGSRAAFAVTLTLALAALAVAAAWYHNASIPVPEPAAPAPVVEVAPVAAVPEPAAPEVPTLMQVLDGSATGLEDAAAALLALWGLDGDDASPASLCRIAREADLACLRERGDWQRLRTLDRPALLELVTPGGDQHAIVLSALEDGRAHVIVGHEEHAVGMEEIGALWFGEMLVLWHAPVPPDSILRVGSTGPHVAALSGMLEGGMVTDTYDQALASRVREFQELAGIEVDGIAGERTLLALDAHSGEGPRLRRHVTDP